MITSRTPLRISLIGGGTDVQSFYRNHGGAVVSFCINKFVHVSVNTKFDGATRISYSLTENVAEPAELKHDLARETLNFFQMRGVEISSMADIPGEGSGLGSSSSFTVGLLNALSKKTMGKTYPCKMLAETAHTIESKLCGHPGVGKQDHYAAAYGGMHYYEFAKDEGVEVQPILIDADQKKYLESHLLLLWTGKTRSANAILKEQADNLQSNREAIFAGCKLRDMAHDLGVALEKGDLHQIGSYLHEGWKMKKRLANTISDQILDRMYEDACAAGAVGGKLLGAGGGGFFLFFADPRNHASIREALALRHVPFELEEKGSTIVYDNETKNAFC